MRRLFGIGAGSLWWLVLAGCGGEAKVAEEPRISPDTVPSLALLMGSGRRGEDVEASGAGESCDAVNHAERERARASGAGEEAPEEHNEAIRSVLDDGSYLNGCEVPGSSSVELCVAVIGGEARGVTVWLKPGTAAQANCVADRVRQLSFPAHDLVSVARTQFDPG